MTTSVYSKLLDHALGAGRVIPKIGYATLVMFEDKSHFEAWATIDPTNPPQEGKDSKIVSLPAQFLFMPGLLQLPLGTTPNDVCVIGVAFGKERDYSDTQLMYHRILQPS